jgi:hypothetical protein
LEQSESDEADDMDKTENEEVVQTPAAAAEETHSTTVHVHDLLTPVKLEYPVTKTSVKGFENYILMSKN